MNDVTMLTVIGVAIIALVAFWIFLGVRAASRDRRYAADATAKAMVLASKEAAKGAVLEQRERERGKRRLAVIGGVFAVLALAVMMTFATVTVSRAISESGRVARTRARYDTLVELDFGRTVRHGQTMEMMTESAWADAYAKRGRGVSFKDIVMIILALVMVGFVVMAGVIIFIGWRSPGSRMLSEGEPAGRLGDSGAGGGGVSVIANAGREFQR